MKISFNLGFVTNSSSAIFHFPNLLLKDQRVINFLSKFEIDGYVSDNLWDRSACTTIALTKEQKVQAFINLRDNDYGPHINIDSDEFVVIYGDEGVSLANTFAHLLRDICEELKIKYEQSEYN